MSAVPPPDRLDYPSAKVPFPRTPRPLRSWILLIFIWSLGLLIWTLYLIVIVYLLTKIL